MGRFDEYKPALAMSGIQFAYAGVALFTRASLLEGMTAEVFVVYRQAIATLSIAPIAFLSRGKSGESSMGWKSFGLIFLAALIGITINQNFYFEGLYLASSSVGTAMNNLVPAVTFIIATMFGLEKVNITSVRSLAKVGGTVLCVSGAISMALLRGPKLLNAEFRPTVSLFGLETDNSWLVGSALVFASTCCWSTWLILQVPVSASYPDHVSLSCWLCFLSTFQSAAIALIFERKWASWVLETKLQIVSVIFCGTIGSALAFFVQSWCISKRGPLYSAMYNPLCTVIVTILAPFVLGEAIYTGSLIGAIVVIIGLYIVLWGKAKEYAKSEVDEKHQNDQVNIFIDESSEETNALEEPLLGDRSTDQNINHTNRNH